MTFPNRLPVRIRQRRREVNNIVAIELESQTGEDLPEFLPGAHIDVVLPSGLIRQYSLCSDPERLDAYRIAVLLEPGSRGGSREVHTLANGQALMISPPRSHFLLSNHHESAVLMAGGIGVTPIMTMALALHRQAIPFAFHYLTRSRALTAFRRELQNAGYAGHVHMRHDDDEGIATQSELVERLGPPTPYRHLYVCGPKSLIEAVVTAARDSGWGEDNIHVEHFKAPDDLGSGEPVALHLARSGTTIAVPGNQSLAKALSDAGVHVPVSCEQGICGTCIVGVIDGLPDHRDCFLSAAERAANDRVAVCCSRALTADLTLDL